MTKPEFRRLKEDLELENYCMKPKCIKELSQRYWIEIRNRVYDFDRYKKEIKLLHSLKQSDLVAFFKVSSSDEKQLRKRVSRNSLPFLENTRCVISRKTQIVLTCVS